MDLREIFRKHREKLELGDESDGLAKLVLESEKVILDQEKAAQARWWWEDTLVHNRLTWLLQSQVIFFAFYGVLAKFGSADEAVREETVMLLKMLPFLGLVICLLISVSVQAAWRAQKVLKKKYDVDKIEISVSDGTTNVGRVPGYGFPLAFAGAWGWLFGQAFGVFSFVVIAVVAMYLARLAMGRFAV